MEVPTVRTILAAQTAAPEAPPIDTSTVPLWSERAACRHTDPETKFGSVTEQTEAAQTLCARCPVVGACLSYALDHRIEFGLWGGVTERKRRSLLRKRPDVRSWRHRVDVALAAAQGGAR
jgi:WhiB family redox-sensing transcriptional regulator